MDQNERLLTELGAALYSELEFQDPSDDRAWSELDDSERALYVSCIERVLARHELVREYYSLTAGARYVGVHYQSLGGGYGSER